MCVSVRDLETVPGLHACMHAVPWWSVVVGGSRWWEGSISLRIEVRPP